MRWRGGVEGEEDSEGREISDVKGGMLGGKVGLNRKSWLGEVPLQTEGGGSETERVLARADVAQLQGE